MTQGIAYQGSVRTDCSGMDEPPSYASLNPDAWIEIRVQYIDQQVAQDEDAGEHDHDGLHHLEVPGSHGIHDQQPDARPGEHGLGYHGTGEERPGDDRKN